MRSFIRMYKKMFAILLIYVVSIYLFAVIIHEFSSTLTTSQYNLAALDGYC